jgi:hypothetical protein
MKPFVAAALVLFLGCSSTTVTYPSWGTVAGVNFVPVDGFFLLSTEPNGDYNIVLVADDQPGWCGVLQENVNGMLANMNYVTLTYANPVGTGPVNPGPGIYPVTASPDAGSVTSQVSFATSSSSCAMSNVLAGTAGAVDMQDIAVDLSQLDGALDVVFGTSGSLSGTFTAPICDTSNSFEGPVQCYQSP